MKWKVLIIVILLSNNKLVAQDNNLGLKIGDTLPAFNIPKIIYSKTKDRNTSFFKNQLLIIDFWRTTCGGCIVSLPDLEMLESKFKGKVRILPVTDETEKNILKFWKNNRYTRGLKGGTVVEDKLFSSYFKHRYIPHEVWIYKGKIIGITSMEYVDEYNIKRVLDGQSVNWPIKNDFYTFDRDKPLFSLDRRQINVNSGLIKYAAISGFRSNSNSPIWLSGGAGIQRDSSKKTVRVFFLNQPILNSYLMYLGQASDHQKLIKPSPSFQANQIVWKVNDKSRYMFEHKEGNYSQDWLLKNGICFESLLPDSGQSDKEIYRLSISNLNRLLGLNVYWKRMNEKVLVIKRNKNRINQPITSSLKGRFSIYDVFFNLNHQSNNPYVFNESGEEKAEIKLNIKNWNDIINIRKSLELAGFDLIEEEREVDKLIFTETDGGRLINRDIQKIALLKRKDQNNFRNPAQEDNKTFLELNKNKVGVKQTASGLQYKILVNGRGRTPTLDDKVLVNQEGRLVNGKIFDSSYENGVPIELKINNVIKGWAEAIQMMQEGAIWEIYIPSSLAYDSHTGNGSVPPNSTLIFKLELIKVMN